MVHTQRAIFEENYITPGMYEVTDNVTKIKHINLRMRFNTKSFNKIIHLHIGFSKAVIP